MKIIKARKWIDQQRDQGSGKKRKVAANQPASAAASVSFKKEHEATPTEHTVPRAIVNLSLVHGPGEVPLEPEIGSFSFPYRPLDPSTLEIRIAVLKPGIGSSPIDCDVQHVATNTKTLPQYRALSYAWGPLSPTRNMLIDGIDVQVRENLWQALYHIRQRDVEVHLWVDAICINQEDIMERNQQVSRMGTLYNQAEEVVVWLGPEGDDSDAAMSFIRSTITTPSRGLSLDVFSSAGAAATLALLDREYWKRLWIVQEVFRARKIVICCGSQTLLWKDLAKFFRRVQNLLLKDKKEQNKIAKHPSYTAITALSHNPASTLTDHRTSRYQDLENLLMSYNRSLCCDPRDKVYSLLGLSRQRLTERSKIMGQTDWISIDYSRSPYKLFQDLTLMYLGEVGDRFLVRWMQLLQNVLELPPPWTASRFPTRAATTAASLTLGSVSCKSYPPTIIESVSPGFFMDLETLAFWIGEDEPGIKKEEDAKEGKEDKRIGYQQLDDWKLHEWYRPFRHSRFPSESRMLSVLNALSSEDIDRLCNFKKGHLIASHKQHEEDETSNPPKTVKLHLFVTQTGRLGITAYPVLPGEEVVRFYGSDIALVTYVQFKGNPLPVRGRAFIIPSDNTGRDPEFVSSFNATFKYAVPSQLDEVEHLDIRIRPEPDVREIEHYRDPHEYRFAPLTGSMTLEQWEYWTW